MKAEKFQEAFRYCPKCGAQFEYNNVKSRKCVSCGFTYYFNPSSATVAIIKNKRGDILVATRAKSPALGTLDLPGGFVDSFESGEQAVAREVLEETRLTTKSVKYLFSVPNLYDYSNFEVHTLDMFFECEVNGLDGIIAQDDVASLRFIPRDEINIDDFGLMSIRAGLKRYLGL